MGERSRRGGESGRDNGRENWRARIYSRAVYRSMTENEKKKVEGENTRA